MVVADRRVHVVEPARRHRVRVGRVVCPLGAPHLGRVERREERQAGLELEAELVDRDDPGAERERLSLQQPHRVLEPPQDAELAVPRMLDGDGEVALGVDPADHAPHREGNTTACSVDIRIPPRFWSCRAVMPQRRSGRSS